MCFVFCIWKCQMHIVFDKVKCVSYLTMWNVYRIWQSEMCIVFDKVYCVSYLTRWNVYCIWQCQMCIVLDNVECVSYLTNLYCIWQGEIMVTVYHWSSLLFVMVEISSYVLFITTVNIVRYSRVITLTGCESIVHNTSSQNITNTQKDKTQTWDSSITDCPHSFLYILSICNNNNNSSLISLLYFISLYVWCHNSFKFSTKTCIRVLYNYSLIKIILEKCIIEIMGRQVLPFWV